ncbi:MAG TPA: hypothetical protein VFA55_00385 [Candidatus Kapabacteria bacterium]|nr:hypothetical protein [Candidatus Kapabacteria bacterium]
MDNFTLKKILFFAGIIVFAFLLALYVPQKLAAQEQHQTSDSSGMGMQMDMSMDMGSDTNDTDTPMSMKGSGTSWLPEAAPMYMAMQNSGDWMLMEHGGAFIRYTHQGGLRGDQKFDAPNWFMAMAERDIGFGGHLRFSGMFSLDPLTESGYGYPLLFQTGETWHGIPLIDRQHPHDLFAELSAYYSQNIFSNARVFGYIGYPGEPALGPPAFMHRPSAMYLPDAPIAHHWQDATHITFGVATLGVVYDRLKIEGSVFNGTEPDENRYDFDTPHFNSYSGRVSFNPSENIALQVSNGFIKDPESDGIDVHRTSASILTSTTIGEDHEWNSSLVWGQNYDTEEGVQNSVLLESAFTFSDYAVSTRIEIVQKPQRELGIFISPTEKETVGEYILGVSRKLFSTEGLDVMLGAQGAVYSMPQTLVRYYGSNPFSFEVYLGIHPSEMAMHMQGM